MSFVLYKFACGILSFKILSGGNGGCVKGEGWDYGIMGEGRGRLGWEGGV